MLPRTVRTISTLALASVLVLLGWGPAGAHAALVGSDPAEGSTHDTAPTSVTFTFNEVVGNPALAVTAPDGTPVPTTQVRAVDRTLTAQLEDVDQRGTYSASFRVVSADGHPIQGTVTYEVTSGRAVTQKTTPGEMAEDQDEGGFVHRHRSHLFWGILAAGIAIALLLEPMRRRDDAHDA